MAESLSRTAVCAIVPSCADRGRKKVEGETKTKLHHCYIRALWNQGICFMSLTQIADLPVSHHCCDASDRCAVFEPPPT